MKNSNYQGLTSHVLEFIFFDEHVFGKLDVLKIYFEHVLKDLAYFYKFLSEHVFVL